MEVGFDHKVTMVFRDAMDQEVRVTIESQSPMIRVYDLIEQLKCQSVMVIPKVEE